MAFRKPQVGDPVITGSHLTYVQRVGKLRGAVGAWHHMRGDMGGWSPYLHFAQEWTITYAKIGVNVCTHAWGTGHPCGLTHLPADELADLTRYETRNP